MVRTWLSWGGTVLPATEGVVRGDGVVKSGEGGATTAGFGHREALCHPVNGSSGMWVEEPMRRGRQVLRVLPGVLQRRRESCATNSRGAAWSGSPNVAPRCGEASLRRA